MPIDASSFQLIYDDAEAIPHVMFPPGRRVLTGTERKREMLANGYDEGKFVTLRETTDAQGRFRIDTVVPETRFHLVAMPTRVDKRFGPQARTYAGEKTIVEAFDNARSGHGPG